MLGQIMWFDDTSGEGMVALEDGSSIYIHWSAIKKGDQSERFVNNKKKKWMSVEAGYIGEVKIYENLYSKQVEEFHLTERKKPNKPQSLFVDRDRMKVRLVACKAEFDEIFPDDNGITDKLFTLRRKIKPTKKDTKDIEILTTQIEHHRTLVNEWNKDKSMAIVAIYREHSKFYNK